MEEAAEQGCKSLVGFCIKAGADVNAVNYKVLKSIIDLGDKELIALALESIKNKTKNNRNQNLT